MNRPPAIFCIGRNYAAHANEMGGPLGPDQPTIFMKNPASIIASEAPIVIPPICTQPGPQVDWEGELAVILRNDLRDAEGDEAMAAIGGYAAANDVTARWWQKEGSGGQWVRGKSFDTFCPLGDPVLAAEVNDPQDLRLITRVNGEVMQDASTAEMIFSVRALLIELSRGLTLLAGTVLLTGTPSGVGVARTPPRFLRADDVVEVEISGLPRLRNPVQLG